MIDRRLIDNFDWSILLVALALSLIGVMTIYSATRPVLDVTQKNFYMKQLYWIVLSLIVFMVVVSIDYKWYMKFGYLIFFFGVILLVLVLVVGRKGMGAQRWINLGFLSFQPSEFFKGFFYHCYFALSLISDARQRVRTAPAVKNNPHIPCRTGGAYSQAA